LAEGHLLDRFITDAYAKPWVRAMAKLAPSWIRAKVDFRSEPGIPLEQVTCLWGTTTIEHLRHQLGLSRRMTIAKLDRNFSWAAARRAAEARSNLFLYSPYAWEAFNVRYPHTPRKVLFQYHPHPTMEQRMLGEDSVKFPGFGESYSGKVSEALPEHLAQRERDCWQKADLILCASAFTKLSLLEAGCDERRCRVVPYGIDTPIVENSLPPQSFQALFVGSGGQRKGLHHLLLAWQKASLPVSSKLTLVCRIIDREIQGLAAATPRVQVISGVSQQQLSELYSSSCLFTMPSLVEGFGQVYLEALAQGCPVLGTANTCLPDLGGEADGVFLVPPGNVDALVEKLEQLGRLLPNNPNLRSAARSCAAKFTWQAFRTGTRMALGHDN
jgi:glycosyltransferase involved in cell wall biosynthesis